MSHIRSIILKRMSNNEIPDLDQLIIDSDGNIIFEDEDFDFQIIEEEEANEIKLETDDNIKKEKKVTKKPTVKKTIKKISEKKPRKTSKK